MTKLKHLFAAISFLTTCLAGSAQLYQVEYIDETGDTSLVKAGAIRKWFDNREQAGIYIAGLPIFLRNQGFITSSVDEIIMDTASARVVLYLGEQYRWARISTIDQDKPYLDAVRWPSSFQGNFDLQNFNTWQFRILDHLENNGHPFGKVFLDSIRIHGNEVNARLRIDPGPAYRIDSIRIYGDARVQNDFLQRYLGIPNGSLYNRSRLENISARLATLTYLQEVKPSTLDMLGTGAILNLYLQDRKTSQVNALIGFLPNSSQLDGGRKLLLTVDANILLRNALGSGETIGLVWQQLQQKSPRLNLLFEQPYIFRSPFGLNFTFDMYKRDSSFLNINMNLGMLYHIEEKQEAAIFIQRRQTIVSAINTAAVIHSRQLPREGDVSSLNLGMSYSLYNTDFRFNPGKGTELHLVASAGSKTIRKNNMILELQDPSEPSFKFESLYDTLKLKAYQLRLEASAARFLPLGGASTLKLGVNGGIYQSASYFRNELFQIGGFRLMRGFDEGSQFVSQYAVGTIEYRLRTGLNSYFFGFIDGGWGKHLLESQQNHTYLGTGLGLSLETKAGLINMALALGKRDDLEFNLRQPKLHIGFASYF